MSDSNRREFLKNTGGIALGLLGAGLAGYAVSCPTQARMKLPAFHGARYWSVHGARHHPGSLQCAGRHLPALAVSTTQQAVVADRTYAAYGSSGCMMATFKAIVGALRDKIQDPPARPSHRHDEIRQCRCGGLGHPVRGLKRRGGG